MNSKRFSLVILSSLLLAGCSFGTIGDDSYVASDDNSGSSNSGNNSGNNIASDFTFKTDFVNADGTANTNKKIKVSTDTLKAQISYNNDYDETNSTSEDYSNSTSVDLSANGLIDLNTFDFDFIVDGKFDDDNFYLDYLMRSFNLFERERTSSNFECFSSTYNMADIELGTSYQEIFNYVELLTGEKVSNAKVYKDLVPYALDYTFGLLFNLGKATNAISLDSDNNINISVYDVFKGFYNDVLSIENTLTASSTIKDLLSNETLIKYFDVFLYNTTAENVKTALDTFNKTDYQYAGKVSSVALNSDETAGEYVSRLLGTTDFSNLVEELTGFKDLLSTPLYTLVYGEKGSFDDFISMIDMVKDYFKFDDATKKITITEKSTGEYLEDSSHYSNKEENPTYIDHLYEDESTASLTDINVKFGLDNSGYASKLALSGKFDENLIENVKQTEPLTEYPYDTTTLTYKHIATYTNTVSAELDGTLEFNSTDSLRDVSTLKVDYNDAQYTFEDEYSVKLNDLPDTTVYAELEGNSNGNISDIYFSVESQTVTSTSYDKHNGTLTIIDNTYGTIVYDVSWHYSDTDNDKKMVYLSLRPDYSLSQPTSAYLNHKNITANALGESSTTAWEYTSVVSLLSGTKDNMGNYLVNDSTYCNTFIDLSDGSWVEVSAKDDDKEESDPDHYNYTVHGDNIKDYSYDATNNQLTVEHSKFGTIVYDLSYDSGTTTSAWTGTNVEYKEIIFTVNADDSELTDDYNDSERHITFYSFGSEESQYLPTYAQFIYSVVVERKTSTIKEFIDSLE